MNIAKKFDLLIIFLTGSFAGISLAEFNEGLQTVALVLTIAGLIWRMFKRKKV